MLVPGDIVVTDEVPADVRKLYEIISVYQASRVRTDIRAKIAFAPDHSRDKLKLILNWNLKWRPATQAEIAAEVADRITCAA